MSEFVDELGRWVHGSLVAPTALHDALRTGSRNEDGSVTQDNGDGTGTRTTYDDKGQVTSTEQVDGLPIADIDPVHTIDDPLAAEVAGLRAVVEALLADPEIAKVADIDAIRTAAEGSKDDDALVIAVAKALGADPAEVRKKRDADPQWFADVVAKYGLGSGKGDEVGAVKGK